MCVPEEEATRDVLEGFEIPPEFLSLQTPYSVEFEIEGVNALLLHRPNFQNEDKQKPGSPSKVSTLERSVYRNDDGEVALPGEYIRMAIINAVDMVDWNSYSRKRKLSDIYRSILVIETEFASLGVKHWDYEDTRRVIINSKPAIRTRPALREGWKASFRCTILEPEHANPEEFFRALIAAGNAIGIGDFRPHFGRFKVNRFKVFDFNNNCQGGIS